MRVLLVSTAREVGGAEIYVERLVAGLRDRCEFTIALSDSPTIEKFALRLGMQSNVVPMPVDRYASLPGVIRQLRQISQAHDLIHLNSNHPASRLGIAMGFGLASSPCPVICVEHRATPVDDVKVPVLLAPVLPELFRWSRRHVARVIAVSKDNARCLQTVYGLPEAKISVVNNGVDIADVQDDTKGISLKEELKLNAEAIIILVVSRIQPNKGHRYLIDAAPAIVESNSQVHFVFAGAEDDRATLDAQIDALSLQSRFHFLGTRSDVPDLLRQCDVFVLPSLAEGFSLALIEAMAAGALVVATKVGGAEEVIEEGINGFLVPAGNSESLFKTINHALKMDIYEVDAMSKSAIKRSQVFSVAAMCDRTFHEYEVAMKTELKILV
jgi:glycosyltransferase involved in cell wall biosynthesis